MTTVNRQWSDYETELSLGNIPNRSVVTKFGHNPVTPTSGGVIRNIGGLALILPTSAAALSVQAGIEDHVGGTGASEVLIEGLDQNYEETSETLTLVGSDTATTVNTYLRVNRAYVTAIGSSAVLGATNIGAVAITHVASMLTRIGSGAGQTTTTAYTVPVSKEALLNSVEGSLLRLAGGGVVEADFHLHQIDSVGVDRMRYLFGVRNDGASTVPIPFGPTDVIFPAKADIYMEAHPNATANITGSYTITLVNKGSG